MHDDATPTLWSRIADSPARLTRHVKWAERAEGGRVRVVLQNESSGVHVRVERWVWEVVQQCDGHHSIADIVTSGTHGVALPEDDADAWYERLALAVATLEQAGFLDLGMASSAERLWVRGESLRRSGARARWMNPLSIRIPLHDPDRLLSRLLPHVERSLQPALIRVWLACLVVVAGLVMSNIGDISAAFSTLISTPRHWWSVLLVWPVLKFIHELAHAVAVRRYGGRVHEWGISFLVLMPVPYVDASDANLFSRRGRMLVGAAGMLAEVSIAALFLGLWVLLEPGLLRDLAFAVFVAGSVNTLLFNANPLLRFDGYYLLQDLFGLSNLARSASGWWGAWVRYRLFGLGDTGGLLSAPGREQRWYAVYGALAIAYRYVVVVSISLWLIDALPLMGVLLALFALWPMFIKPVYVSARWLLHSERLQDRRRLALYRVAACVAMVALVVGVVPVPSSTRVVGVVAVEGSAALVAPETGHLVDIADRRVSAGDLVARISAPELEEEASLLDAERTALKAEHAAAMQSDVLDAQLVNRELAMLDRRVDVLTDRLASLDIRADRDGRFVPAITGAERGRLLQQGDAIGQIVDGRALRVQAVVREHQLERVRDGVAAVHVRLAESVFEPLEGALLRQSPSSTRQLPSAALAGEGPGGIAVARKDDSFETLDPVFNVEVGLPEDVHVSGVGERAYVTFVHSPESFADRWWRLTRQLFLERLFV